MMRRASAQVIAATPGDLKNNRLGLMSGAQLRSLSGQIAGFRLRISRLARRVVIMAGVITIGVVLLAFARVIWLPFALGFEALVVGGMLYLIAAANRFLAQLELDLEAESVRIVRGRTSRSTLRAHPLYCTIRVELGAYRLFDCRLAREFTTGDLYQYYVLPHSQVIIGAERID